MTRQRRALLVLVVLGVLVWAGGKLAILYADYLWFDALGCASVFMTELWAKAVLGGSAFLVTGLWLTGHIYLAARLSPGRHFEFRSLPWVMTGGQLRRLSLGIGTVLILVAAYAFGTGAADRWYDVLQLLNRTSFEWRDPIFGYDAGFYVFVLPLLEVLRNYVMAMAVGGAAAAVVTYFLGGGIGWPYARITRAATLHLAALVSLLLVAVGFDYWLSMFGLMLSARGIVFGAGYVDVHVRMPVMAVMAGASVVVAGLVLVGGLTARPKVAYTAVLVLVLLHVGAVWSYPSFSQRFDVEPNELVREMPYLAHNIRATRFAYGLSDVEVRPYAATGSLTLKEVEQVTGTVDNIRIWDWRVLKSTYNQIESLRPYYHFSDVDVDRYTVGGQYRQVTLAVRELATSLLNPDSRTWVNLHLLYTHGYGAVMSPVNAVTAEGLPDLWIRNIPPQSRIDLHITRPEVYFGEQTYDYVFIHTTQKEFDYPLGDENRYNEYEGKAGVLIDSTWRRLLFAFYFGDWNILLTDSFTPETRVLWARQVQDRVRRLTPFLGFDGDPYPVLLDGRIVWVVDAYTRTDRFPYSARVPPAHEGLNYIRNSIKAVVDAYDGHVTFYVVDPADALALAAHSIFPALFKDAAEMPAGLRAHLRYPVDLFEIQAEQYLTYHMTDPRILYNKEDLWQRPDHDFGGARQPLAAYYFIMNLPAEERPEYILMLPFTPAKKDNMVGWMAGRCDGRDYGKLLVYTFPKDRLIFGPNQVEARINQNDEISPQLTLWNQHGSRVIRGNLLVIPLGDSILYVEPLYLRSENAAIPELKRVIVSYQDRIAMRPTLRDALAAAFGEQTAAPPTPIARPAAPPPPDLEARRARSVELFEKAQRLMREGNWAGYGATMAELGKLLREIEPTPPGQTPGPSPPPPPPPPPAKKP